MLSKMRRQLKELKLWKSYRRHLEFKAWVRKMYMERNILSIQVVI